MREEKKVSMVEPYNSKLCTLTKKKANQKVRGLFSTINKPPIIHKSVSEVQPVLL